jgi:tRNA pseudouridine55 synthase
MPEASSKSGKKVFKMNPVRNGVSGRDISTPVRNQRSLNGANGVNGILVIDKPRGLTSHDVIDVIRETFKIKKAGHAGTLDPMATGVLVVLIGKATKLSAELASSDKEYEVDCLLGTTTETDDLEGRILEVKEEIRITKERLEETLSEFKGEIKQKVPRYSAKKVGGKKLYELARKKKNFVQPTKKVTIYKLEIIDFNKPVAKLKVSCSKGTYIRSLCRDIGKALGTGGCVSNLRRTVSGPFTLKDTLNLKKLKSLSKDKLDKIILPIKDHESLFRFIQSKKV